MAERDRVERDTSEHDPERRLRDSALLIGAGRRARATGAALAALSTLDPQGERRREPLSQLDLADLEELLARRALEGLLILESGRVPGEDIGFVRRFLERHPHWHLVVVGEDEQAARALLALPRARWLAWPPDLEELRALLTPATPPPPMAAPERAERGPRRPTPRAAPAVNGGVDLGNLLEELLAGAALQGEGTARYQFLRGEACLVLQERATLVEGLSGLLELARQCAGREGLVRAALDPRGETILIGLEFPRAGLPENDLPSLFEGLANAVDPALAEGLAAARRGAELLREIGGRVELASGEPGRVRCEVRLSANPRARARPGPASKPEDPFA